MVDPASLGGGPVEHTLRLVKLGLLAVACVVLAWRMWRSGRFF